MSDEAETEMKIVTRRKFLGGLTLAGVSVPVVTAVVAGQAQHPSRQIKQRQYEMMIAAARNFLNTLSPELRTKAVFPFKSDERFNWHYIPPIITSVPDSLQLMFERKGVSLKDTSKVQRIAAHSLLQSALSTRSQVSHEFRCSPRAR